MRRWNPLAALATLSLLAACGSEPTAAPVVRDDPAQPTRSTAAAFTATVVGPTSVYVNSCNMWYVSVSGGTPPYTYEWIGFDYFYPDMTGASVQGGFTGIGHVPVSAYVYDATGAMAHAGIGILVQSRRLAEPCNY